MQFSILAIWCCACILMPLSASATAPQQTKKKPTANTSQRPANVYGTPSLSPAAQSTKRQKQSPNFVPPTGRTNKGKPNPRPSVSMLPAPTNYRPGPVNPAPGSSNPRDLSPDRRPGNRPVNNRPDVVINRPDINFSQPTLNRPIIKWGTVNQPQINRPVTNNSNTAINNTTINNTTINNNAAAINQNFNNRQARNNRFDDYRPTRTYYPELHNHWRPSSWSGAYRPAYYNYGYANVSGSWLNVGGMNLAYVNPFYVQSLASPGFRFDYSQPIRVPAPDYRESQDDLIRSERAIRRFDDAREVFRRGEYGRANELIDEAIDLLPSDPTLHQFRALVLFARQRYQESAAVLYSVIAVSNGWDAATLGKLYDSPATYLAQVGDLKQFVATHPEAIESQFLLAYHDVVKGDLDGAQRLLEGVRAAQPNDRVVQSVLAALR